MLHKIVATFAFGIALSLASMSTDAMAAGGTGAAGGHGGIGGGVRGGSVGVQGGRFGPGFMGRGIGGRGFNRDFARDRFFARDRLFARDRFFRPGWGSGGGWWGPPGFVDDDMCFAWTPSGYRWACGY